MIIRILIDFSGIDAAPVLNGPGGPRDTGKLQESKHRIRVDQELRQIGETVD